MRTITLEYFNPIIGLILIKLMIFDSFQEARFQSHYRSDFNPPLLYVVWQCLYFNPIIGLILIKHLQVLTVLSISFQSHYRSDFNRVKFLLFHHITNVNLLF